MFGAGVDRGLDRQLGRDGDGAGRLRDADLLRGNWRGRRRGRGGFVGAGTGTGTVTVASTVTGAVTVAGTVTGVTAVAGTGTVTCVVAVAGTVTCVVTVAGTVTITVAPPTACKKPRRLTQRWNAPALDAAHDERAGVAGRARQSQVNRRIRFVHIAGQEMRRALRPQRAQRDFDGGDASALDHLRAQVDQAVQRRVVARLVDIAPADARVGDARRDFRRRQSHRDARGRQHHVMRDAVFRPHRAQAMRIRVQAARRQRRGQERRGRHAARHAVERVGDVEQRVAVNRATGDAL